MKTYTQLNQAGIEFLKNQLAQHAKNVDESRINAWIDDVNERALDVEFGSKTSNYELASSETKNGRAHVIRFICDEHFAVQDVE